MTGQRGAVIRDEALRLFAEHGPDAVLGEDPLSAAGMARWGREMLAIYAAGLMAVPHGNERPQESGGGR